MKRITTSLTLILLLVSWIMINAIWGLTGSGTLISRWLEEISTLWWSIIVSSFIFLLVIIIGLRNGNRKFIAVILMIMAYTFGVMVSEFARQNLQPSNIFLNRSFILIPAIPMFLVFLFMKSDTSHHFKFGDWNVQSTIFGIGNQKWSKIFLYSVLFIALPAWLLFQSGVQFEPLKSGQFFNSLPTIIGLSFLNGFSEELLFRGFLLIPLISLLGISKGIWLQAVFFGIHHWGASPELVSGFVMSIILAFLGVLLGRSVTATKGLAWAIFFHTTLDIATLSVYLT